MRSAMRTTVTACSPPGRDGRAGAGACDGGSESLTVGRARPCPVAIRLAPAAATSARFPAGPAGFGAGGAGARPAGNRDDRLLASRPGQPRRSEAGGGQARGGEAGRGQAGGGRAGQSGFLASGPGPGRRCPWHLPVWHGPHAGGAAVADGLPGLGRGHVGGGIADRQHGVAGIGLRTGTAPVVARPRSWAAGLRPDGLRARSLRPAGISLRGPGRGPAGLAAVPRRELARRVHGRRLAGYRRIAPDRALTGRAVGGRAVPAAGRLAIVAPARGALRRLRVSVVVRDRHPVWPTGELGVSSFAGRGAHAASVSPRGRGPPRFDRCRLGPVSCLSVHAYWHARHSLCDW